MANLLPENETYEFEGRDYLNPNVSLNEQTSFIDQFRATQAQNNQEINTDTYNLGTAVPSNLGGLTGGEGYWTSRYQVPQTESLAEMLRATAQAKALEDALANEQAKWKKRYNDAYHANAKRNSNTTDPSTSGDPSEEGDVDEKVVGSTDFFGVPDSILSEDDDYYIYTDPDTGKQVKVSKEFMKKLYDENGQLTEDGQVILDTREMLGM